MTSIPLAATGDAPSSDDGMRPIEGVVATLRTIDSQMACLAFDDVTSGAATRDKSWNFRVFYTHAAFSQNAVTEMPLTDEQYRDIGIALMARLVAFQDLERKNQRGAGVA